MSPTCATTRSGWLFDWEPEDRALDLVELEIGGSPWLAEAQFPIAAGTRRQEAVEQPPHDRALPVIHCALLRVYPGQRVTGGEWRHGLGWH